MGAIKKRAVGWTTVLLALVALVACGSTAEEPGTPSVPPQDNPGAGGMLGTWPEAAAEPEASGNIDTGGGTEAGGGVEASSGVEAGGASSGHDSAAGRDADSTPDGSKDGASTDALDPCASDTRACSPGDTSSTQVDCQGSCGAGKATQALKCGSDCTWVNSGPPGACDDKGACVPGAHKERTVSCSCPGNTKTQQMTCGSNCTWDGQWVDLNTSSCTVDCCGELVYCDTPASVAPNRGTWCRKTTSACSDAETWDDCKALLVDVGCTLHQPMYLD
jgi:hypothetical protein